MSQLLFKGILSTRVGHSSKILTLHVGHTLSLSQNHDTIVLSGTMVLLSSLLGNLEPNN